MFLSFSQSVDRFNQLLGVTTKFPGWNLYEDTPLSKFGMEAQITSLSLGYNPLSSVDTYGNVTLYPVFVGDMTSGSKGLAVINWFVADLYYQSIAECYNQVS